MTNYAAALAALDALAETERGATPGPWLFGHDGACYGQPGDGLLFDDFEDENGLAIVALHNIAPEMIALARAVVEARAAAVRVDALFFGERGLFTDAVVERDAAEREEKSAMRALIAALTKGEGE